MLCRDSDCCDARLVAAELEPQSGCLDHEIGRSRKDAGDQHDKGEVREESGATVEGEPVIPKSPDDRLVPEKDAVRDHARSDEQRRLQDS